MEERIYKGYLRPMLNHIKNNYKIPEDGLIGVEIGIKGGSNSLFILNNLPIKKLYLIDPYKRYPEIDVSYNPIDMKLILIENVINKFNNVELIEKMSSEAITDVPNNLDFVYIDGNHFLKYIKQDIHNYYPKVRIGGYLGGHDYSIGAPSNDVKKAVDRFIYKNNLYLYYERGDDPHTIKRKGINDWWIIK